MSPKTDNDRRRGTHLASCHEDPCTHVAQTGRRGRCDEFHRVLSQRYLEPTKCGVPDFSRSLLDLQWHWGSTSQNALQACCNSSASTDGTRTYLNSAENVARRAVRASAEGAGKELESCLRNSGEMVFCRLCASFRKRLDACNWLSQDLSGDHHVRRDRYSRGSIRNATQQGGP